MAEIAAQAVGYGRPSEKFFSDGLWLSDLISGGFSEFVWVWSAVPNRVTVCLQRGKNTVGTVNRFKAV
ncbi:hypothetical protein [Neisseria sp.]|uniref:hypothetical protein n=1 Tax=Neisseria sp. TaxID=192066 RepID=UPI0035A11E07